MNFISYDIDYFYYESFLKEIEEICNKPYHFYREVELRFKAIKAKRMLIKIEKLNLYFIESIYEIDFNTVLETEKRAKQILELSTTIIKGCSQCPYTKCKEVFSDVYFIPLMISFEKLLKSIQNSYHLNADDIFKTDEEYKENNEALKAFADLWDNEPTIEEKEHVFRHNVETNVV
ncbi:MAG: hypothetical protein Q7T72_13675 [Bacteroidales bacterium]|nr:hypothetical protein [Bacteroidales bacterium]